jgi:transcriptional regulator with PAS, ATPase and Fis domain
MHEWIQELPMGITVADHEGTVIEMNDTAAATFVGQGGKDLIGTSLFACHQARSSAMIKSMLESGEPHSYTITKKGQKKLIHQQPWFKDGKVAGLVEFSIVLPTDMVHYDRG